MSDRNVGVFGIYSTRASIEFASEVLSTAGFPASDISVLMKKNLEDSSEMAGLAVGLTLGSITGALIGLGLPAYEAKQYAGHAEVGGILLSVQCHTAGEVTRTKEIMETTGGEHISSSGEFMVDTIDFALAGIGPIRH